MAPAGAPKNVPKFWLYQTVCFYIKAAQCYQIKPELLNLLPSKKDSNECDGRSKPLPKDCILNILLNLQKLGMEIDDITAEALSDKMMSEIKSQEELHDLTIWYPLLTSNKKGNLL